jgi:hypothetical protein
MNTLEFLIKILVKVFHIELEENVYNGIGTDRRSKTARNTRLHIAFLLYFAIMPKGTKLHTLTTTFA